MDSEVNIKTETVTVRDQWRAEMHKLNLLKYRIKGEIK